MLIDRSGQMFSAQEVLDGSSQRAASLAASGVRTGSTVLMSCSPSVDLILTYIALMRLGVTIVPANTGYTDRELEYIVDDAKLAAAVVDEPAKLRWLERHGVEMVIGPALDLPQAPVMGDLPTVDATSAAFIAYTSGTTGAPKAVMYSTDNFMANRDLHFAMADPVAVRQERLLVVEEFGVDEPKTKQLAGKLKDLGVKSVLIVVEGFDEKLFLASRNLPHVEVIEATGVDPVSLARFEHVLITVAAVKRVEERLA